VADPPIHGVPAGCSPKSRISLHRSTRMLSEVPAVLAPASPSSLAIRGVNHRMFRVGRDLWGPPSPTPCRSRVTQSRLHRILSRQGLNIPRERIHSREGEGLPASRGCLVQERGFISQSHSFQKFTQRLWGGGGGGGIKLKTLAAQLLLSSGKASFQL